MRHGSRLRVDRWDPATCGAREAGKSTRPRADHRESRGVTAVTAATANVTGARHGGHGGVRHHSGHGGYYYSGYYYGGHGGYSHGGHGGYEPDGGHYHGAHNGSHGDRHAYIGCYAVAPPTISSHHITTSLLRLLPVRLLRALLQQQQLPGPPVPPSPRFAPA